ncbi:hypothetical protein [Arthrobacter sp. KK5.5]|uniref:hypothetical protein n=1 Tax=Arthrobacter sp. KK5.5 TaxID=3373084 RepID=UPI003EE76103
MRITVTVDSEHADRVEEVASHLSGAGMRVDRVLGSLGMVSGTADDACRPALDAVAGVASIDVQLEVAIAPPEDDIQ